MLRSEIIVFGFEILTKHKNILCGQNTEILNINLVVYKVNTRLLKVLL